MGASCSDACRANDIVAQSKLKESLRISSKHLPSDCTAAEPRWNELDLRRPSADGSSRLKAGEETMLKLSMEPVDTNAYQRRPSNDSQCPMKPGEQVTAMLEMEDDVASPRVNKTRGRTPSKESSTAMKPSKKAKANPRDKLASSGTNSTLVEPCLEPQSVAASEPAHQRPGWAKLAKKAETSSMQKSDEQAALELKTSEKTTVTSDMHMAEACGEQMLEAQEWRASHILIKHRDSRNPVSRRTGKTVARSKEQAFKELQKVMADLSPSNFSAKARSISDCSSYKVDGDLDWFGPGDMQAPFELATKTIGVGQISDIVDTDSGLHVLIRTG